LEGGREGEGERARTLAKYCASSFLKNWRSPTPSMSVGSSVVMPSASALTPVSGIMKPPVSASGASVSLRAGVRMGA